MEIFKQNVLVEASYGKQWTPKQLNKLSTFKIGINAYGFKKNYIQGGFSESEIESGHSREGFSVI